MWRRLWWSALCLLVCVPAWAAQGQQGDAQPAARVLPYDRPGLVSDTLHFVGYQFGAAMVIAIDGANDVSNPERDWWHNVTHPTWDDDGTVVNYVLHPYWGAAYYVRGRERGLRSGQAFWYSVFMSTLFEFGAEAMVEQVSYQDLWITPVLGSLLGAYVFWPVRERILAKPGPLDTSDRVTLVMTDPLGAINSAVDRLFGVKSDVAVGPVVLGGASTAHRFGAATGAMRPRPRAGWGVQLRVEW